MYKLLFIFTMLTVFVNAQTYTVFSRESGCQAHWVFDSTYAAYKVKYVEYDYTGNGNNIAFASSGGDYPGKLTADESFIEGGMVIDPVPADLDRMVIFNPDEAFADVDGTGNLSILGRHKHQAATVPVITNKSNLTAANAGWYLEQRSGGLFRFYLSDGTNTVSTAAIDMGIENGDSYSWAIIFDRSTELIKFYTNGDSVNAVDWSGTTLGDMSNIIPLAVFNNGSLNTTYMDNPVYELQIYNVALTTEQVGTIMSNQEVANTTRKKKYSGFSERNKY